MIVSIMSTDFRDGDLWAWTIKENRCPVALLQIDYSFLVGLTWRSFVVSIL